MKTLIKNSKFAVTDHLADTDAAHQFSRENDLRLLQKLAQRLINAHEEERQRISQEMHDDFGNRIALIALSLRQLITQQTHNSSSTTRELEKIFEQITDLAAAVRDLSHGLHPPLLRHVGIKAALTSLRDRLEKTPGIRVHLVVEGGLPRLRDEAALCVFRITQEALNNVAKHSGADRASVVLERTPSGIKLMVSDIGRGFIPSESKTDGLGLRSMEARALSVGGRLTVHSSPGAGTRIYLKIPL